MTTPELLQRYARKAIDKAIIELEDVVILANYRRLTHDAAYAAMLDAEASLRQVKERHDNEMSIAVYETRLIDAETDELEQREQYEIAATELNNAREYLHSQITDYLTVAISLGME